MPEMGHLLFTANRLSQGRSGMVDRLLEYAAMHLDWSPDAIDPEQVCAAVRGRILKFVMNHEVHGYIDRVSVEEALVQQVGYLRGLLGSATGLLFSNNAFARGMVDLDHHWIVANNGRYRAPRRAEPPTDFHDAWLSHACHFCLNGKSTRHPVFDKLMAELRPLMVNGGETRQRLLGTVGGFQLREVVRVHNERHPEEPVTLAD
jgi:hypothetical protein